MPSLAASRSRAFTLLLALTPILALAAAAFAPLGAQTTTLSHFDDAAPIPAGMLRLRVANAWTRYDERFAPGGATTTLSAELSADSLGRTQFPRLLPIEAGLRTLATDPALRLSLGQLRVGSNARIVTTPVAIEYGVTRRLSVGLLIPIVQTRRVAMASVAGDSTRANAGYVPLASRTTAASANLAVATAFQRAADSLGVLLARCPTTPSAQGCAAVNANATDAAAARARAQSFADAVRVLGVTEASAIVAPRKSSALATTIDARRVELNQRLQQYLGAGAGAASSIFTALTDFSYRDLQGNRAAGTPGFLQSTLGGGLDSIHTTERFGFGDIAVGAQYMLVDRFQRDMSPPPRLQTRLAVGGAVRFATSLPDSAQSLVDIPTGDGAGVELRSAWDVIVGHVGATVAARYVKSFSRTVQAPLLGDPEAIFPYPLFGQRQRTAGDVIGVDLTPRVLLSETFALDAHYGFERVGATTYGAPDVIPPDPCATCQSVLALPIVTVSGTARKAQRLGLGLRYSTVDAYARGQAGYPVEVSFTHLTTTTGDPGVAKQSRDQIQVRLFYQIWRRR
jgi:hypothetical protein